jgi:hypothetical protein
MVRTRHVFYGDRGFLGKMAKGGTFLEEQFVDIRNQESPVLLFPTLDLNIFYLSDCELTSSE